MSWLRLLIIACATWRISYMIAREHGVLHIFSRLREVTTLGGLLTCPKCLSVWVALALYALEWHTPHISNVFALSGLALLLHRYTGGDYEGG